MNMKDVITRIEQRANELDLSEARLCKEAGLSDSAIRNWRRRIDNGETDFSATANTLQKLADRLGVTIAWLQTGSADGFAEPPANSLGEMLTQTRPPCGTSENKQVRTENQIKIGTDGERIQLIADIDKEGLDALRRKLDQIEAMLD